MVNPQMPDQWTISLGESAEKLAGIYGISREAQDEFALRSHQRAHAAYDDGLLRRRGRAGARAPSSSATRAIRADTSLEKLAKLKPAFVEGGTVTAGQLLAAQRRRGRDAARRRGTAGGCSAASRWRGSSPRRGTASTPTSSGSRPVEAANRALERRGSAGTTSPWSSSTRRSPRSRWRALRSWPELDPDKRQPERRRDRDRTSAGRFGRAGPRLASPTSCSAAAAATASPRSASASARASP